MAALTDEDLEKKRERNEKLREQIATAEAKAASTVQDHTREIEAAQLDAETARLEQRLTAAKEAAKASNLKAGAAGPLAAAKDQLEAAQTATTPPGVTVDTNTKSDSSSDSTDKNAKG